MGLGCAYSLLAVEELGAGVRHSEVKWSEVGDVSGVDIHEVGVDAGVAWLGARLVEGGASEGVVVGAEVDMDDIAGIDTIDVLWLEAELLVSTSGDSICGSCCG